MENTCSKPVELIATRSKQAREGEGICLPTAKNQSSETFLNKQFWRFLVLPKFCLRGARGRFQTLVCATGNRNQVKLWFGSMQASRTSQSLFFLQCDISQKIRNVMSASSMLHIDPFRKLQRQCGMSVQTFQCASWNAGHRAVNGFFKIIQSFLRFELAYRQLQVSLEPFLSTCKLHAQTLRYCS